MDFSPDSKFIVTTGNDSVLKLWDLATGNFIRDFIGHSGYVWTVNYSPDG